MYPLLLTAACLIGQGSHLASEGHLIVVGGGPTPPEIPEKALALAGGTRAHVLIVPFASNRADAGQRGERLWRLAGAENIAVLDLTDRKAALRAVRQADVIWMSGGSQNRLMQMLTTAGMVGPIRDRYRHGAVVAGTSAGAAVMSTVMLTGLVKSDVLYIGPVHAGSGLGLWPGVIIDQHFLRRARTNRLLSAVLSHPESVGIGIDECTAVVVSGTSFEVIGRQNVMVIDARKATLPTAHTGEPLAASGVSLYVLRRGMMFSLAPPGAPPAGGAGKVADKTDRGKNTARARRTQASMN